MYQNILKSYISNLGFVSKKIIPYYTKCEINLISNKENQNYISGTININPSSSESELILFETKLTKTEDTLMFKTKYQNKADLYEEIDIFTIIPDKQIAYSTPKTKLLIHIVNGNLFKAYRVGKKYKFENGINENLSKFNLEKKDVVNMLNQNIENKNNKRR